MKQSGTELQKLGSFRSWEASEAGKLQKLGSFRSWLRA
jgi:hypothetical protein